MNRLAFLASILLAGSLASLPARAQAPAANVIAKITPGLAWKVELLPESKRTKWDRSGTAARTPHTGNPKERLSTVVEENVIGQGFRRQIRKTPGQKDQVRYSTGDMIFVEGGPTGISLAAPANEFDSGTLSLSAIEGFEWVRPERFVGTATVDGEVCEIYFGPWPIDPATLATDNRRPDSLGSQTVLAAISRADRLPRRLEDPNTIRSYRFGRTNSPPVLPAEILSAWEQYRTNLQREAKRYQVPQ